MQWSAVKFLWVWLMCFLFVPCLAQSDTAQMQRSLHKTDSVSIDSSLYHLSKDTDFNTAVSNPVWYLISAIAPVFNVGIGYTYMVPLNTFANKVTPTSAFTFDIGINLTRIFANPEANWQLYACFAADFTNFGKSGAFNTNNGDTTYETRITNEMEVLSPYLELEHNGEAFSPFFTAGYSKIYLNPSKTTVMKIRNPTTNYSENSGGSLDNLSSDGINLGLGLKYKYRFKDYRALILCLKGVTVYGTSTEMVDLKTVSFNNNGEATFQKKTVTPSWFQCSILLKYNF